MPEQYPMRRCARCTADRPLDDFPRDRSRSSGRHPYCKPCHRAVSAARTQSGDWREWRRQAAARNYAAARELLNRLKSAPCTDCGGTFPPYVMQYDHRDPASKRRNVSTWASAGCITGMLAEIARCDLVCANCHAIRSHAQRQAGVFPHRPRRAG
jgi:hypothetical protein